MFVSYLGTSSNLVMSWGNIFFVDDAAHPTSHLNKAKIESSSQYYEKTNTSHGDVISTIAIALISLPFLLWHRCCVFFSKKENKLCVRWCVCHRHFMRVKYYIYLSKEFNILTSNAKTISSIIQIFFFFLVCLFACNLSIFRPEIEEFAHKINQWLFKIIYIRPEWPEKTIDERIFSKTGQIWRKSMHQ